jgi:hypothetical protein
LEAHPHVSDLVLATIHPCRHAAVMMRLIEQFQDNGKELSVLVSYFEYFFANFICFLGLPFHFPQIRSGKKLLKI